MINWTSRPFGHPSIRRPTRIGQSSKPSQYGSSKYRRLVLDSRDGGVQTIRGADAARVPSEVALLS